MTVVALSGCHALLPFDQHAPPDASGDAMSPTDGPADLSLSAELPPPVDAWPSPEGPLDDAEVPSDGVTSDGGTDGPMDSACVAGVLTTQSYAPDMVTCRYSTGFDQCAAASWCGAGWHPCTAVEYQARGGMQTKPTEGAAWLGACVRQGGGPAQSPTPGPCSTCLGTPTASVEVSFDTCGGASGSPASTAAPDVGVRTNGQCLRVGEDLPANEGMWRARDAEDLQLAVVCCQ
jgi:hypothetical protein